MRPTIRSISIDDDGLSILFDGPDADPPAELVVRQVRGFDAAGSHTCRTCAHWKANGGGDISGRCQRIKWAGHAAADDPVGIIADGDESRLVTSPMFGCALWEVDQF